MTWDWELFWSLDISIWLIIPFKIYNKVYSKLKYVILLSCLLRKHTLNSQTKEILNSPSIWIEWCCTLQHHRSIFEHVSFVQFNGDVFVVVWLSKFNMCELRWLKIKFACYLFSFLVLCYRHFQFYLTSPHSLTFWIIMYIIMDEFVCMQSTLPLSCLPLIKHFNAIFLSHHKIRQKPLCFSFL